MSTRGRNFRKIKVVRVSLFFSSLDDLPLNYSYACGRSDVIKAKWNQVRKFIDDLDAEQFQEYIQLAHVQQTQGWAEEDAASRN